MRYLWMVILALGLTHYAVAKPKGRAKTAPQATVPTEAEKVEKFAELRLRGNLKRPELAYDFEDESKNSEIPLTVPDEFNDELFRDIERQ